MAATVVTPQKAITQKVVKTSKPEMKSCAKERTELQVVGKHKASSVNLPPREMLTSNVRGNRVQENFRKPNKEVTCWHSGDSAISNFRIKECNSFSD
ncbi:hypothetical protein E2562_001068 [Oryza meyeriana var. granulata]|uniref:Uncharacterized protein n=1 Tax=Oryza meyeriana var. granulata TaxID=110450 RepID=A0A6G1ED00_9ORYZ|nr:hypothetical protein E2562_001068 [Oryza meyeriana var. granulata]